MKQIKILYLFFLLSLFLGCAVTTSSHYITVTRPAQVNLKGYDKMIVSEITAFEGEGKVVSALKTFSQILHGVGSKKEIGKSITSKLKGAIIESRFSVIDSLLSVPGDVLIVSGSVQSYDYDEKTEERIGVSSMSDLRYYRDGTGKLTVNLKIKDVKTGQYLVDKIFSSTRGRRKTSKDRNTLPDIDKSVIQRECEEYIVKDFMQYILPYTEKVQVSFELAEDMPELERGATMVKIKNWDEAIGIFQEAIADNPSSLDLHKAYYNLGLCYLYTDQFEKAKTELEKAYNLNPQEKYEEAVKEVDTRMENNRRLEEQITR